MMHSIVKLAMVTATGLMAGAQPAMAQADDGFYNNREVKLLIGSPPGGGYDTFARLFARHAGRFVPGAPRIIAQNMPGGGGLVMTNAIFNQQPRDGSVMGSGNGSMGTASLFGVPNARYDARQLGWIGSLNAEVGLAVARTDSPVKSNADLFRHELISGGSGANDGNVIFANAMNNILGTKFRVVTGYGGTAKISMAIESGEVQGTASWHYSSMHVAKPEWLQGKVVNVVAQLSLMRHSALPDVPTVLDMAKTDEQRALVRLVFAQQDMGRPLYFPPGVPAQRLEIWRRAFDAFINDADVLAEVKKLRLEINRPMRGVEIEALIAELHKMPKDLVQKAYQATRPPQAK